MFQQIRFALIAITLAASAMIPAQAATWFYGGVLVGNVCRAGAFYWVYPISYAQPVGTSCSFMLQGTPFYGYVSNE